jgi:Tol biopolymer transport system component/DNA-binding winged helix-turn-helix (wHTH) protein
VGGTIKRVYEFGPFRLDAKERLLWQDGSTLPLTSKLFDTLLLLVENSGHLLLKDELMKSLWPDSFVEDVNLSQSISRLRKVLGETPGRQYIATVAGHGYRFIADVREIPDRGKAADTLVIESHARERVVVEEEDYDDHEAGKLVVAPALPAGRSLRRAYWLIPLAVAVTALGWFALPPRPPRLIASIQITNDGHLKWQKWQGWEGPLLLTDGSRIFMVEDGHKGQTLVQVPVAGGETVTVPVPVPFPRFQLTDMDHQHSELLMQDWYDNPVALEGPLWAYSVVNGGYRRLGDLSVSDAIWASDGHILFTRGDGMWSADSNGSEEHLLVKLPGFPHAPRASPDGRVVRFTLADPQTHSTSLWEVSRDGKNAHPLLQGWNNSSRECCGSWTPDGRYYVFQSLREGKWSIWALRERGGWFRGSRGPFQLTTGPIDYVSPTISLDGKQLFAVGMQSRNELLRFDREKNQFVPFLPELSSTSLTFSKDGQWVAYTSDVDGQLWRAKADGSNRQQLTFGPSIVALPSWSPDGERIVFAAGLRGPWANWVRTWKMYVVPAKGGPATELLPESQGVLDGTWSPDGKRLAFDSPLGGLGLDSHSGIFTLELETRRLTKVPGSDGLFSARWSPGGQLVALTAGPKRLVLYDATKQSWSELGDNKAAFPRWSHDDKYVYFDALDRNKGLVCRVDVHSRKTECIASLENLRAGGPLGYWSGLTPDDAPLFTRDAGSQEIYAFDLELP